MKTGYTFFNRNHNVFLTLLPAILTLFTACEKVLDIDLKEAEARIVIEGNVTDQPGPYVVSLTKSVSFSDPNVFPAVTGALVTISDNAGNTEILTETEAGSYKSTNLKGVPGRNYFLKVVAESQEYNAVSNMSQQAIQIQEITVDKFEFNQDELVAKIKFQDPAGVKNFYRALYIVNGKASDNLFFLDDQFQDGSLIEGTFFDQDLKLKSGDIVSIELQCIDEANLNYLREEDMLNGQSASPANPTTNISNNALGYFSAHTESTATITVP
jgi:hypothetical protein